MDGPHRYLCSQLVSLVTSGGQLWANLEEIWPEGAVLESECSVPENSHVEMRCGEVLFAGRVGAAVQHEFGWRLEVEFSPLTPWSLACFRPEHLLDTGAISESP